jgi:hypothetical protein
MRKVSVEFTVNTDKGPSDASRMVADCLSGILGWDEYFNHGIVGCEVGHEYILDGWEPDPQCMGDYEWLEKCDERYRK